MKYEAIGSDSGQEINPIVTPVSVRELPDGQIDVDVHQLIKDLQGNVLTDGVVKHIYTVDEGKIRKMVIETSAH